MESNALKAMCALQLLRKSVFKVTLRVYLPSKKLFELM